MAPTAASGAASARCRALWTGASSTTRTRCTAAWDLCKHWTVEDRIKKLRDDAARTGLKGKVAGRPVQQVAEELLDIARHGLRRRARFSGGLVDETGYLSELEEIAESGLTPADRLLALYHDKWNGDVTRVYEEFAY